MQEFRTIEVGATIRTGCGQTYRKRSRTTLEMAPGHTHYDPENVRWFYAQQREPFEVVEMNSPQFSQDRIRSARLEKARRNVTEGVLEEAERLARLFGFSYTPTDSAPEDWEGIKAAWLHSQRTRSGFPVRESDSDDTIFLNKEANWAQRFIHDAYHVILDRGLHFHDELAVAAEHVRWAEARWGSDSVEVALIAFDTVGQTMHYHKTHAFLESQEAAMLAWLGSYGRSLV